ncbi:hypothetical protein OHAE_1749 [Ochrobactrum soli]|uniref:Uncharacterized protein n=1 Tax=Ochrobactrum soli TaxID=2448455 RepID=A0A2P9HP57_9HYPH|nr:hypothetical protein OHAE_1749 [[Ochrobactrum] soli]
MTLAGAAVGRIYNFSNYFKELRRMMAGGSPSSALLLVTSQ